MVCTTGGSQIIFCLYGSSERVEKILEQVRKIDRKFRKSPTKNDILQKYKRDDHGKELKVILDCKTTWNRMLVMLELFPLLENSIQKALKRVIF